MAVKRKFKLDEQYAYTILSWDENCRSDLNLLRSPVAQCIDTYIDKVHTTVFSIHASHLDFYQILIMTEFTAYILL